jgi:hypothetical protein
MKKTLSVVALTVGTFFALASYTPHIPAYQQTLTNWNIPLPQGQLVQTHLSKVEAKPFKGDTIISFDEKKLDINGAKAWVKQLGRAGFYGMELDQINNNYSADLTNGKTNTVAHVIADPLTHTTSYRIVKGKN